ncbi:MAG: polysaccharide deacetylase family protein [Thermacetogeniaceae bacterium]
MTWRRFLTVLAIGMAILIPAGLLATRLDLKAGSLKVKQAAGEQESKAGADKDHKESEAPAGAKGDQPPAEAKPASSGKETKENEQPSPPREAAGEPPGRPGVVYLTFDDGPNTVTTPQILDILKSYGVKATFFVTGHNARLNPGVLRRIAEEGHAIGNHSFSHDYNLYRNPSAFAADLDQAEEAIQAATGLRPTLYRPPGGTYHLTPELREILAKKGYSVVGWNVSSADTDPHGVTPEQLVNNVLEGVAKASRKGMAAVVLMHDGAQTSKNPAPGTPDYLYVKNREADVAALPAIIERLKEEGYTFLPL